MANAINLIDGLDGLAAGIVAIAAGAFFLYGTTARRCGPARRGQPRPADRVIMLGMCLGFLPYNFHPARIFMGDGGALLLGLLMAASTMRRRRVVPSEPFSGQAFFFFAPLFIPLVHPRRADPRHRVRDRPRATRRAGVADADKDHLHHRLMRLGHGQRRSVLILWAWTALLSGFVLYPTYTSEGDAIVPFGVAALGLALYTVLHPGVRQSSRRRPLKRARRPASRADARARLR